eukprot:11878237-Prorocentrum_lima.AAC.1
MQLSEDQHPFVNLHMLGQPPLAPSDTLEHQAATLTGHISSLASESSSRFPRPTKKPWITPRTRQLINTRRHWMSL